MSELVQSAVSSLLAQESDPRLSNLLKAGQPFLVKELRQNWLPQGWSRDKELQGEMSENLIPDSQEAADAAEADADRLDKAGARWGKLSETEKSSLLSAVESLTDKETAAETRRMLDQSAPLEVNAETEN